MSAFYCATHFLLCHCRSRIFFTAKLQNIYRQINLPYHYEKPYYYNNKKFLPDFTVMNPWTGENFMHEHFGGFHLEGYGQKKIEKVRAYKKAGLKNMENIIYTYEEDLEDLAHFKEIILQGILQL